MGSACVGSEDGCERLHSDESRVWLHRQQSRNKERKNLPGLDGTASTRAWVLPRSHVFWWKRGICPQLLSQPGKWVCWTLVLHNGSQQALGRMRRAYLWYVYLLRVSVFSPLCRFAPWLFRPLADSPPWLGRFAPLNTDKSMSSSRPTRAINCNMYITHTL